MGRNGDSDLDQRIAQQRSEVRSLRNQVRGQIQPVIDRGVLVRDPGRGLVDFPALRDGLEVCLCWLMGEEAIGFWHDVDAGFPGRQPLSHISQISRVGAS